MEDGHTPVPPGYRVRPADDLRRLSDGRILIGGSPLSIVRLSEPGAAAVSAWFAGGPIGAAESQHRLARRLRSNGMAHLEPELEPNGRSGRSLTVVIPVKDDQPGLERTLAILLDRDDRAAEPDLDLSVIVVDDGSTPPVTVVADDVSVLRNDRSLGPGGARQRAFADAPNQTADTESDESDDDDDTVCFIDAGVEISRASLLRLAERLDDPAVVAVAPRVLSEPQDHAVGRYDERRSPLDLGPSTALVGVGRSVPYLPTACLLVRADVAERVGGFDPDLRYGEDVDLVWRLGEVGDVLYVAEIEATHPPRRTVMAMAKQRMSYGSAAAPLAVRHGDAVSPARLSGWSVLIATLVASGHPLVALGLGGWTARALRPKIEPLPDVTVEAAMLTGKGHWYGALSLLTALARTWSPFMIVAAVLVPSQRRRLALLMAAAAGRRLLDGPRQPAAAGLDIALGAVDDLSYCAGVWQGVLKHRSLRALKPTVVSWPGPKGGANQSTAGE